jgi:NAD+ synthase (glutamine-hydrolysing)
LSSEADQRSYAWQKFDAMINQLSSNKITATRSLLLRVVIPELRVADVAFNTGVIRDALHRSAEEASQPQLLLFPELSLTGSTCGDLFFQPQLQEKALESLASLHETAQQLNLWTVVGLPLAFTGRLYDAAVLLNPQGAIGVSLASQPRDFSGCYPSRWFAPAAALPSQEINLLGKHVPIAADLTLQLPDLLPGNLQICIGDLRDGQYDHSVSLLLNPCALPALAEPVLLTASSYAQRLQAPGVIAFASCGPCESTTDLVMSGLGGIAQTGKLLAETQPLQLGTQSVAAEVSLSVTVPPESERQGTRPVSPLSQTPFIARADPEAQCERAFAIQSAALIRRLRHTGIKRVVLGISGGSDSSLALLVCSQAFAQLGLDQKDIFAISLPGPGSSAGAKQRLERLAALAGVTFRTIPIGSALEQHLRDIGHPLDLFDVTYENAQARERTQILMDFANQHQALVVGTGDLSEIALGWCTFNGDHMTMYNPNAGLPKTLLLRVLAWAGEALFGAEGAAITQQICNATISPELIPAGADSAPAQATEASIGPYVLHDFFLYYAIGQRLSPQEVFTLAKQAFAGSYTTREILQWMRVFYSRFFSQQFKRSASTDGPQIVELSLSPRGGWMMPSDASAALWIEEIQALENSVE